MEYFVRLGMSRMEAISAATKNGAAILGREKDLGTIEKGKLADLQVVDGNPLDSFQALSHPSLVMIGGAVLRTGGVEPR
jgi:imidazolonepropionase-like amidohydrolase